MDNIKVLMYGWEFPPLISGGLGVACYAIVQELVKKGVKLTLVLPQVVVSKSVAGVNFVSCTANLSPVDRELLKTIDVLYPQFTTRFGSYSNSYTHQQKVSDEVRQELLSMLDKMQLSSELSSLMYDMLSNDGYTFSLLVEVLRYALLAGAFVKDVIHDVIHAHDWLTILAALVARNCSHKPVVFHVHALETDRSGLWLDKRIFAIEKYGLEQADQIIAVSQYTKNSIVQFYGISPTKITVVHNGIYVPTSESDLQKKTSHPMVLFLGRITQQKGPYFFIEVAKRVLKKRPDVHFVLAGTGDLLPSMIERVAELRIGKNVHFTGFLTGESIRDIYKLADIYVMPSVSEPFGLSALEALSCNVPTIVSKQSGVVEVLRHTLVSDFWDTEDMASKILALLDYRALRETYLMQARDNLDNLTWDQTAGKILCLYQQLLSGN